MKSKKMSDYRYKYICSCCGQYVTKEDRELPDNDDTEGNLCSQCYGEQQLQAWFEMKEVFDKISGALKPINRLKFDYEHDSVKWHYATKLMKKGIIKWEMKNTDKYIIREGSWTGNFPNSIGLFKKAMS